MQILCNGPTIGIYLDIRNEIAKGENKGKYPVKIRITFQITKEKFKQTYFHTSTFLSEDEFEKVKNDRAYGDLAAISSTITIAKARAHNIAKENPAITPEEFSSLFISNQNLREYQNSKKDFIAFAFKELEEQAGILSKKTSAGYTSCLNNLKAWRTSIAFEEIDHSLLLKYKNYLAGERNRKMNGYYQDFATIKKFHRIAQVKGLASSNPFAHFRFGKEETTKNWNSEVELTKLHVLLDSEKISSDLEKIMEKAEINKHITYHCSRHTFAINCILLGIDLITVRDWLGHASVTTTEIYAKIAQQYKDESMKKWANFGKLKIAC